MILEYTRLQKRSFSKGYDYWCVFISGKGTLAKLFACYKAGNSVPDCPNAVPEAFLILNGFKGKGLTLIWNTPIC